MVSGIQQKGCSLWFVELTLIYCSLHFQASEDAKRLVNQERSFACAEIESARAVVQRFGEALEEEEKLAQTSGKQVCKGCMY